MLKLDIQKFAAAGSISVTVLSQDIENNSSKIRVTYTVRRTSGSSYWANARTVTFTIDGKTVTSSLNLPSSSTSNYCYVDATIGHNNDGTKTISVSAECPVSGVNGTPFGANATITLNTIPRKTICPDVSGDIESTYNIALNPASSSFTHSIYVTFGSVTGYINGSGNLQSDEYRFSNNNIPFTIPSTFYQQFSEKSGIGSFRLRTYNGESNIGETTATLTATCLESRCRPSINGTVKDCNAITIALSGNENQLIKSFSNALITLTINASTTNKDTRSTITARSVDGISFSETSITLNKVTKKDFTIVITNSRGFQTSKIVSANGSLVNYFVPSITIEPFRYPDQTSSQIKMTYKGSFFNQNFGSIQNTITMKWYWKLSTAKDWTLGGLVTPTNNGNTITEQTIDCGSEFHYQNAYRLKLEVIDKLSSSGSKEADILRGIPIYSQGTNWFQHHTNVYLESGNKILDQYILFTNTKKEIDNLVLSDAITNYKYIKIYYEKDNFQSVKEINISSSTIEFTLDLIYAVEDTIQVIVAVYNINNKNITKINTRYFNVYDYRISSMGSSDSLVITKIIGYK